MTDPAHSRSDLTGSDDTRGLAIEVHTCKTYQTEIILTNLDIALMDSSGNRKCQCHRMLCNRLR